MKEKRLNKTIIQWLFPIVLLLLVISIMLTRFVATSSKKEKAEVEEQLIAMVEDYAAQMRQTLGGIQKGADAMASYMARTSEENVDINAVMMAVGDTAGVYNVVICEPDGRGIRRSGEAIDLSSKDYFAEAFTGEKKIFYVSDDGLHGGEAIIIVSPVIRQQEVKAYVVCYCNPSGIEKLIKKIDFDKDAFYMIIDTEGPVMALSGNTESGLCEKTTDYFAFLRQTADIQQGAERIRNRIQNSNADISYVACGEERKGLVYVPVGVGRFYMLVGVPQSYIDKAIKDEWSDAESILWQFGIALLAFIGVIVVINILTRIKENEKSIQLANKADTDLLTELYNKVATERKIKEYIAEHPDEQGLMFVLDIDNFKKINDTMGHAFGDEVLRTLGTRIKAEFRTSDIIGRTGGDEFTIFLCNMKEDAAIRSEANRVERFFRDFQAGEYVKYSATASIGAAVFPKDATSFEGLYKAADQALYVAKKRGKNQLAFYGDDKQ